MIFITKISLFRVINNQKLSVTDITDKHGYNYAELK